MSYHLDTQGKYEYGWLEQTCSKCNWYEKAHGTERANCPQCGAPVSEDRFIEIGILRVKYNPIKKRFYISENQNTVTLYDVDLPELLVFIARNWKDWSGRLEEVSGEEGT